jgi:hypothetical protein
MSENERRPESPVWRQIVGAVWRVEKKTWREAAVIGLIGGIIGAAAAGTLGYQLYGWGGLLAGGAGGFIVGWLLLVLFLQSASFFY